MEYTNRYRRPRYFFLVGHCPSDCSLDDWPVVATVQTVRGEVAPLSRAVSTRTSKAGCSLTSVTTCSPCCSSFSTLKPSSSILGLCRIRRVEKRHWTVHPARNGNLRLPSDHRPHLRLEEEGVGMDMNLEQLAVDEQEAVERNVLFTTLEQIKAWARSNSMWPLQFGLACCAIEMMTARVPRGTISTALACSTTTAPQARRHDRFRDSKKITMHSHYYDQMPEPKRVIAMGSCATAGGPYICEIVFSHQRG